MVKVPSYLAFCGALHLDRGFTAIVTKDMRKNADLCKYVETFLQDNKETPLIILEAYKRVILGHVYRKEEFGDAFTGAGIVAHLDLAGEENVSFFKQALAAVTNQNVYTQKHVPIFY